MGGGGCEGLPLGRLRWGCTSQTFSGPNLFFFNLFYPYTVELASVSFKGLSIQETLSFRGHKNLVAEKCSHY